MIYFLLFGEFFKIGLLAIGGGMVTIPFLIELSQEYDWFTMKELTDMLAISESTPGPLGINMATYVGYTTAGIWGGIIATLGLLTPSVIIMLVIGKFLIKYQSCPTFQNILYGIRPAVLALILYAGVMIAKVSLLDWLSIFLGIAIWVIYHYNKKHPIFFIIMGALIGIILKL